MNSAEWWIAAIFLCFSLQLRSLRLYIALGKLRPALRIVNFAQVCGVVCGFLSFAFAYELVVLTLCSLWKRKKIVMSLYSLMVLRGFDVSVLLIIALFAAPVQEVRIFLLFLLILSVVIWLGIYGVVPILMRLERFLLSFPESIKGDRQVLQWSFFFRKSLMDSTWRRRGTLPLIASLSVFSWLFEWAALFMILGEPQSASLAIVERVGSSMGLAHPAEPLRAYSQLMPAIYGLALCSGLYIVIRNILLRRRAWIPW